AGVINIITQQSDKSLYAQADLSTGNLGLANLNMTVGGKLGKGKHLFRYRFWGGYQQMDDLNTKFDREFNYNPLTYDETGSYLDEPSYSGSIDSVGLGELPTESRYFGTDLSYRNWRFTYHYMGREYHSSIGLNPISSVYDQPGTLFAENINSLNLSYTKAFSRLTLTSNLSYLNYRLDESSNYFSVFNYQHPFFNYFYGASDDIRFEQIAAFTFSPSISLVTGGTFQYSGNLPFTTYLDEPFDPDDYSPFSTTSFRDEDDMPGPGGEDATPFLIPDPITFSRYSLFAEWSFNFGNFSAQAGGRFDNNSEFGSTFSPRLGMTYRINDNHILRGSFSMANRNPSSFHTYNTLELRRVPRMGGPGDTLIYFPIVNDELTTERLITGELGIRNFFSEDMTWDVSVYFNNNQDHFTFSLLD
ncbi:MAG: TonB-dependent receptor, partial [Bacteroidota bacterium]